MTANASVQAVRFGIGGLVATFVHVLLAYLLIVSWAADAAVANGLAFCGATWVSYRVNTRWSFSSHPTPRRLLRFLVVAALGSLMSALIGGTADRLGFPWWCGILLVVLCVPPLTFVAHRLWTYR